MCFSGNNHIVCRSMTKPPALGHFTTPTAPNREPPPKKALKLSGLSGFRPLHLSFVSCCLSRLHDDDDPLCFAALPFDGFLPGNLRANQMLNVVVHHFLSRVLMDFVPEVVLRGLEGDVSALSLRSNSLVSGGSDGTVSLWDLATRRESITLRAAHNQTVLSCGILLDSFFRYILVALAIIE